jgi:hypothetical protein
MAKDALLAHAQDELGISEITTARPIQAALTSAATFAVGAAMPLLMVLVAPTHLLVWIVSGVSLAFLAVLGAVGAQAGGANILRATARVTFWGALAMAQDSGCPLVAVDMLSGLCADSGRILAEAGYLGRPASLTVTFDSPRLGHMLGDGAMLSGRLVVADIGLGPWRDAWACSRDAELVDTAAPSGQLAKQAGHKYSHGHALILGGGPGQGGAARLAARAALRHPRKGRGAVAGAARAASASAFRLARRASISLLIFSKSALRCLTALS